jgi:hypothetical protein
VQKLFLILMLFTVSLLAQSKEGDEDKFGIKFSGFIKTDFMYDTRQTVNVRAGHFLLYPAIEKLDKNGKDINDVNHFNILAIQTRVRAAIKGPDVLGAKTSGLIEGAFFGHTEGDINGLRLRHAFLKLDWENSSLLMGQYWHPMFIPEVFPGTISFNTGVPFQPFSRNPQIKYTYKINGFHISATASTQRDFNSRGPEGPNCSYLRNSGVPVLDLTLKYISKNMVLGAGINYKTLLPRLSDADSNEVLYKTDIKISGLSTIAFAKFVFGDFIIKAEGTLGENLTDLLMLGGYAESKVNNMGFVTEYTPIKTMSTWADLVYGKDLQFGLFTGYTKNLGSDDTIVGTNYSRGSNIASVMRISPRLQYQIGKTRFAGELEYTSASYGTPDNKGEVKNTTSVDNIRLVLATYLFF